MKKLLFGIMLVVAVVFTGCENPLDKMKETADAIDAVTELKSNSEALKQIFDGRTDFTTYKTEDLTTIDRALYNIEKITNSEIFMSAISELSSLHGIDLKNDINQYKVHIDKLKENNVVIDADNNGDTVAETEILAKIERIANKLATV